MCGLAYKNRNEFRLVINYVKYRYAIELSLVMIIIFYENTLKPLGLN